jgi:predicted amidohydrolase YtcJ
VTRLQEAERKLGSPTEALAGWGLDPIYYGDRRVERADFDRVSTTRAVGVMHASGHIFNVNTRALEMAGLLRPGVNHPGIPLGNDGLPTGELKGPDAMTIVGAHVGFDREALANDEDGLRRFSRLCVRQGVTTATDLANLLPDDAVSMMARVTGEAGFPVRIVSFRRFQALTPEQVAQMSRDECRDALAQVSRARSQPDLDQATRDRLKREFDALMAGLRSRG